MVYDILPEENLHFSDIRYCLNAGGGSVNNNVASAFKESANINMWSKHKPVRLAVNFCQDFNSSAPNYNSSWWKGQDRNCGINPLRVNSYLNLPEHQDGGNNGWTYSLPNGGETQPYRLGDFAGYKKDAMPPYSNFYVPDIVYKNNTTFKVGAMFNPVAGDSLTAEDIDEIKDCYFGAYIVGKNVSIRATSKSIGIPIVEFPTSYLNVGDYTVYPFLCTVPYDVADNEVVCSYYTVPNLNPATFEVKASSIRISIHAILYRDERRVHYKISVINDSGGSTTFSNNWVYLRYDDKNFEDPFLVNEKRVELGDVVAGTGTTVIAEGDFTNVSSDLILGCKVWCSLKSGYYIHGVPPLIDVSEIPK